LFVLVSFHAFARPSYEGITWKKEVTREVEISNKEAPTARRNAKKPADATLVELLISAVRAGRLVAYSNTDINFSTRLSMEELDGMTASKRDTFMITDPVSGEEHRKVVARDFKPDAIHKYRVLEQWTFAPYTGRTEIQIVGIAPIREVFSSDGSFRGVQAMFWLQYKDAAPFLDKYEQSHTDSNIRTGIWTDYFSADNKSAPVGSIWQTKATRIITIPVNRDDTVIHHLRDEVADSTLSEVIAARKCNGIITSYSDFDSGFKHVLPKYGINEGWTFAADTQAITDPVTHLEVIKLITRSFHSYDEEKFELLQNWSFDLARGRTTIEIVAVAPAGRPGGDDPKPKIAPMFWVKYEDVQNIIYTYDQYYPGNTMAKNIWTDYFLADERPVIQK